MSSYTSTIEFTVAEVNQAALDALPDISPGRPAAWPITAAEADRLALHAVTTYGEFGEPL